MVCQPKIVKPTLIFSSLILIKVAVISWCGTTMIIIVNKCEHVNSQLISETVILAVAVYIFLEACLEHLIQAIINSLGKS